MLNSKKSQVAVFVIIGLVMLIITAMFFFITSQEKEEIAPGVYVSIQEVPTEIDPVSSFITQCLEDVSSKGLKIIGEHGGYISLDDPILSGETFYISRNPTESDAVIFAPGGEFKIPYWYYLESSNTCSQCAFKSKRPPLRNEENSIEKQLNRHIEKELPSCLDNFAGLKEQGYEISVKDNLKANTKVAENDVVIVLDYGVKAKKGDVSSSLEQFFIRVPVDLQEIYNLATEITNLQQQYRFLERQTMNLISSFAAVDVDKLPPTSDMKFELGTANIWLKSDVKQKISQMLSAYISLFQVDGTKNFNHNFYSSELKQRVYDSMIVPVANPAYNNLEVTFNYLDFWPLYFDLNCDGEVCEPESATSSVLSFFGIQRYNFAYDVSFPALVEIFDESALNNQGYKFNFFLESNVRNNKELMSEFIPLQTVSVPRTSLLCTLSNKKSGDVTVKALNKITGMPVKDASVSFYVAGESCYIGKTNEEGILTTKFPTGTIGGLVSILKQDYLKSSKLFDAKTNKEDYIDFNLDPVLGKKIVVKKKLMEKVGDSWQFSNKISDLKPNEEAFVSLKRISSLNEDDFSAVVNVRGDEESKIKLSPGKYELSINLFSREHLVIPEKKETRKTGLFTEKEFTIPGIEFGENNPYPSGGLKLNITITKEDMKKGTIVLYALGIALDRVIASKKSITDIQESAKINEYSRVFAALLKPEFK